MPTVEETVQIDRSPQEVFDFLTDAANLPVWDTTTVRAEQVGSEPAGVGTRTRGTSKIVGKEFEWATEVTEFEAPTHVTWTAVEGKMKFSVTNTLEAAAGGTKLTYRIDAESGLGGVFGRLADPFIANIQARTVRANLETLAELLGHQANA